MSYTKVANPLILSSELLTNGMFSGNASSWTLGSHWAYSSLNALHSTGATADLKQSGLSITDGLSYRLAFQISGTAGSVTVKISSSGATQSVNAATGQNTLTLLAPSSNDGTLYFTPTTDFDGAISAVGLRPISTLYTKVAKQSY